MDGHWLTDLYITISCNVAVFIDDKQNVACDFESDGFLCGYSVEPSSYSDFVWQRSKVITANVVGDPTEDGQGSELGKI